MDWKNNKVEYYLEESKKPENQVFFARIASRLLELGRPKEAAGLCEENAGKYANYLSGLMVLGESYLALKDYEKAKEILNLALKLDPDNLRGLYLLGRTAKASGEIILALSFFERVLEADPYCEEAASESEKLRREIESREFPVPAYAAKTDKVRIPAGIQVEAKKASQPVSHEPEAEERMRPAHKEVGGEFMVIKEVGVDTPLVGIDARQAEKISEPVGHTSSMSPHELEPPPSPAPPAPPASSPATGGSKPLFETASIAEIYAKQGLFELALRVYQKLLNANPEEALYKNKIAELEQKIKEQHTT